MMPIPPPNGCRGFHLDSHDLSCEILSCEILHDDINLVLVFVPEVIQTRGFREPLRLPEDL